MYNIINLQYRLSYVKNDDNVCLGRRQPIVCSVANKLRVGTKYSSWKLLTWHYIGPRCQPIKNMMTSSGSQCSPAIAYNSYSNSILCLHKPMLRRSPSKVVRNQILVPLPTWRGKTFPKPSFHYINPCSFTNCTTKRIQFLLQIIFRFFVFDQI